MVAVKKQLQQEETQVLSKLQEEPAIDKTRNDNPLSSVAAVTETVTVPSEVAPEAQVSETLVIENKKGNVTLSHAEHGKRDGCSSCHGDAVPGPFELGKSTAHTMCKGCHKEQGVAVKCSSCHKK